MKFPEMMLFVRMLYILISSRLVYMYIFFLLMPIEGSDPASNTEPNTENYHPHFRSNSANARLKRIDKKLGLLTTGNSETSDSESEQIAKPVDGRGKKVAPREPGISTILPKRPSGKPVLLPGVSPIQRSDSEDSFFITSQSMQGSRPNSVARSSNSSTPRKTPVDLHPDILTYERIKNFPKRLSTPPSLPRLPTSSRTGTPASYLITTPLISRPPTQGGVVFDAIVELSSPAESSDVDFSSKSSVASSDGVGAKRDVNVLFLDGEEKEQQSADKADVESVCSGLVPERQTEDRNSDTESSTSDGSVCEGTERELGSEGGNVGKLGNEVDVDNAINIEGSSFDGDNNDDKMTSKPDVIAAQGSSQESSDTDSDSESDSDADDPVRQMDKKQNQNILDEEETNQNSVAMKTDVVAKDTDVAMVTGVKETMVARDLDDSETTSSETDSESEEEIDLTSSTSSTSESSDSSDSGSSGSRSRPTRVRFARKNNQKGRQGHKNDSVKKSPGSISGSGGTTRNMSASLTGQRGALSLRVESDRPSTSYGRGGIGLGDQEVWFQADVRKDGRKVGFERNVGKDLGKVGDEMKKKILPPIRKASGVEVSAMKQLTSEIGEPSAQVRPLSGAGDVITAQVRPSSGAGDVITAQVRPSSGAGDVIRIPHGKERVESVDSYTKKTSNKDRAHCDAAGHRKTSEMKKKQIDEALISDAKVPAYDAPSPPNARTNLGLAVQKFENANIGGALLKEWNVLDAEAQPAKDSMHPGLTSQFLHASFF
jgi:hypothetical protein